MNRTLLSFAWLAFATTILSWSVGCGGDTGETKPEEPKPDQAEVSTNNATADTARTDPAKTGDGGENKDDRDESKDETLADKTGDNKSDDKAAEENSETGDPAIAGVSKSDNAEDPSQDDTASKVAGAPGETPSEQASGEGEPNNTSPAEASDAKPDLKTERVVVFTIQGPFIVDVVLSIDGQPHNQALAKLTSYVLKSADTNGDGKPTWEELTNSPKFIYGQLGNAALNSSELKRNAIQLYDVIRNGRVDASEVPRFLTRNAGGSRSFDFRSANYYRDINRTDSPTFLLIDANEDGRLDMAEAEGAANRLLGRDADSDGVLFLDEVLSADNNRAGPLTRRRVSAASSSAWIGQKTKWTNLLFEMEEQYMLGGGLEPSVFGLTPKLFDQLDLDDDGRITSKEIAGLADAEPHIRIEAHFGERAEDEDGSRLTVAFVHPEIEEIAKYQIDPDRITIDLPGDRLLIFLRDNAGVQQVRQRAMALLTQYDADKNGYLDEDEFPEAAPGLMGGLEAYDANNDGKVYPDELREFFANAGMAQRSQIRSRAGDQIDAFFDTLDTNHDGRLDGREVQAAPAVVKGLDRNSDGELIVDEIPGSMALAIVRGNPQAETLFAIPVSQPRTPENAPRWFIQMDRNQDGAIAAGEFLGENRQFAKLDEDGNGFLTVEEIGPAAKETGKTDPSGDDAKAPEPGAEGDTEAKGDASPPSENPSSSEQPVDKNAEAPSKAKAIVPADLPAESPVKE